MAQFTRVKNWVSGEVLYAADLNAEFDNLLNGFTPAMIDGASGDVASMQTNVDPGESGTESLASNILGEIQRLRFAIKEIKGSTYWYQSVTGDLTNGVPLLFSDQGVRNLGLATSVSSSALTVSLKQAAGSDPAAGNGAVSNYYRSSTLATGTLAKVSVTGALSIVVPSGATLGHRDGILLPIYVYLINNAGASEIAVSSKLYNENSRVTTTTIDTAADSATGIYSTTGRTNVALRLVGRLWSNQVTAGTWDSSISQIDLLPLNIKPTFEIMRFYDGSTFGSTNTRVPIFTTAQADNTSNGLITYATSATNGDSFTAAKDCYLFMTYADSEASARDIGLILNGSGADFTGSILTVTTSKVIACARLGSGAANATAHVKLKAGDVVTPSMSGSSNGTRFISLIAQEFIP